MARTPGLIEPVLVCAATAVEARACAQGIARAGQSHRFEIMRCGVGPRQAEASLKSRLRNDTRVARVVSAGFAGALASGISEGATIGSWIQASEVRSAKTIGQPGPSLPGLPLDLLPLDASFLRGALLSVEAIDSSAAGVPSAPDRPESASFVDMETFALASICRSAGLKLSALRMITDTPAQPLPSFIGSFTAVATATSWSDRLQSALRGSREFLAAPGESTQWLSQARDFPRLLSAGWEALATTIATLDDGR